MVFLTRNLLLLLLSKYPLSTAIKVPSISSLTATVDHTSCYYYSSYKLSCNILPWFKKGDLIILPSFYCKNLLFLLLLDKPLWFSQGIDISDGSFKLCFFIYLKTHFIFSMGVSLCMDLKTVIMTIWEYYYFIDWGDFIV